MTVLKDDLEPRKTKRETLTRNYCHSCQAPVCNDLSGEDGKLDKRVRLMSSLGSNDRMLSSRLWSDGAFPPSHVQGACLN